MFYFGFSEPMHKPRTGANNNNSGVLVTRVVWAFDLSTQDAEAGGSRLVWSVLQVPDWPGHTARTHL